MAKINLILLAGGIGSRAGDTPKQFVTLQNGKTPVEMLLDSYEGVSGIDQVVFVFHPAWRDFSHLLLSKSNLNYRMVRGGETRQQSIKNALDAIDCDYVLIQDTARPLVQRGVIEAVLANLGENDIVQPVLPSETTMFHTVDGGIDIVPRGSVAEPQCPVGFKFSHLKECYDKTDRDFNDSLSLIRSFCSPTIFNLPGHQSGFKITYPEDIELLNAYIKVQNER